MLRQQVVRITRPVSFTSSRLFTNVAARMAGGDAGSGFSGSQGMAQGDTWTKREKASEDMWIKKDEREKLMKLKEKLAQQKKHIDELDKHIDDITKEQGGENN